MKYTTGATVEAILDEDGTVLYMDYVAHGTREQATAHRPSPGEIQAWLRARGAVLGDEVTTYAHQVRNVRVWDVWPSPGRIDAYLAVIDRNVKRIEVTATPVLVELR